MSANALIAPTMIRVVTLTAQWGTRPPSASRTWPGDEARRVGGEEERGPDHLVRDRRARCTSHARAMLLRLGRVVADHVGVDGAGGARVRRMPCAATRPPWTSGQDIIAAFAAAYIAAYDEKRNAPAEITFTIAAGDGLVEVGAPPAPGTRGRGG